MNQIYYIIEQYLNHQLDEDEKIAFERMMADDADFAALVHQHRMEHDAMELMIEQDLRNFMQNLSSEIVPEESKTPLTLVHRKNPYRLALPLAASTLIAVFCLWFFTSKDTNPQNELVVITPTIENNTLSPKTDEAQTSKTETQSPQKKQLETGIAPVVKKQEHFEVWKQEKINTLAIAEDFYADGPNMTTSALRSSSKENENTNDAFNLYQLKKYNETLAKINEIQQNTTSSMQMEWLKANTFFQLKNYDNALIAFKNIAKNKNNPLAEAAEYYLLLSKMALNSTQKIDFQEDIELILKDSEHGYYEKTLKINELIKESTRK
jgi:anti-sigma-K factor RskA